MGNYIESWRLYQSGQFAFLGAFWVDRPSRHRPHAFSPQDPLVAVELFRRFNWDPEPGILEGIRQKFRPAGRTS